jgi:hypothetical protein
MQKRFAQSFNGGECQPRGRGDLRMRWRTKFDSQLGRNIGALARTINMTAVDKAVEVRPERARLYYCSPAGKQYVA